MLRDPGRLSPVDRLLAVAVASVTTCALWATHAGVGYVRDEGYYFKAARLYQGWFRQLGTDWSHGRFVQPFTDAVTSRHWEYNHEHPPLAKAAFALSHLLFKETLGWLDDVTAFRLPAFVAGGLVSLLLFLLARRYGRGVALLAPALFWLVPRHFFHGHLACFDIPVVATWCFSLWAYGRAVETGKGALLAGVAFGLALATKHNAFFLPIVCVGHWLVTDRRDLFHVGFWGALSRAPLALWSMALVGPAVLYVAWPWLWHHPVDRVAWWIGFHQHHVHYPWEYLGTLLREPPFPWSYPLVLEWLTLPAATMVAILLGLGRELVRGVASLFDRLNGFASKADAHDLLLLAGTVVAVLPFMTTRVPIFGGVKHWMPAVALACIPAARLLADAARALVPDDRPDFAPFATAVLATLVLVPGALATARFHPFGTSAYTELAGGAPGGAALGMQRQYWSNNVTAALPLLNERTPRNGSVYLHEVNYESYEEYKRSGLLRADIRYARGHEDADLVAYQHHREFRDREFDTWRVFGTTRPLRTFVVDETPQVTVYERKR